MPKRAKPPSLRLNLPEIHAARVEYEGAYRAGRKKIPAWVEGIILGLLSRLPTEDQPGLARFIMTRPGPEG